ncbi:MAG: response regulator [Pseudomonadota bacterium]
MLVLVAENDLSSRLIAQSILQRDGYKVRMASDGKNAIQLALSSQFDVILLDIVMPSLGGLQTATHLKGLMGSDCMTATPLIALTAYDTPYDVDRCNRAGFDALIAKPLRKGDLSAALSGLQTTQATSLIKSAANSTDPSALPLLDETVIRSGPGLADELTRERIWLSYRSSLSRALKDIAYNLPSSVEGDIKSTEAFRAALHALRSASLTVGMNRAPYLARELRFAGTEELVPRTAELLQTVKETLPLLNSVLMELSSASITSR